MNIYRHFYRHICWTEFNNKYSLVSVESSNTATTKTKNDIQKFTFTPKRNNAFANNVLVRGEIRM